MELLLDVARAVNLSACEEISRVPLSLSLSLSLASSRKRTETLERGCEQLLDRTRDTATRKCTLTRNSSLFISLAD